MKLYICSDLHIEFGDCFIENRDDIDVLVLSGDICVAKDLDRPDKRGDQVRGFFQRISKDFPEIVYVMGNHEFYHGDFAKTQDLIQGALDGLGITNIHLLEKSTWQHDDWLFIGGTLWTDCNRQDPLTMMHVRERMSDHHHIRNSAVSFYRFLPEHAVTEHHAMVKFVTDIIDQRRAAGDHSLRVIVVGHHAPSRQSTHPRYRGDYYLNGAYSSNLDDFILDRPEIVLWTHGHTHEDFDYMIGTTRVACNPRGYVGYEPRADSWQPKLIEV